MSRRATCDTFRRPFPEVLSWTDDDAEPTADLWATAEESREQIVELYRRVGAHSDVTVSTLSLDAVGQVPWWPAEHSEVTLHRVLLHLVAETDRHAGHADIVRELIDGAAGLSDGNSNLPDSDPHWWEGYRVRLEEVARQFPG